jgi:signal transduction histidine kinase
MNGFPAAVERYLERVLIERARPLLLTFDNAWQLREMTGDAARFGFDAVAPEVAIERLRDLFLGLPTGELQDFPFVELAGGGSAHVHLVPDGELFHVLVLDASEEHERTRAQQQLGNEAELASIEKSRALARLREIRSELERQRAGLEEAHALKNALIATLSHEFRTPLTSIFGYLHVLERRGGEDAGLDALRAIRRNATYLFALAENLLEYGRSESDAASGRTASLVNAERVDLPRLAADLDAMFRPLAHDKGLEFHFDPVEPPPADTLFDEVKLRQVLINLLSNAVRYTQRGHVRASIVWRAPMLELAVSDTGIGISPEYRERVFKAFNRGAQSGSRGAGLGLSIVKRLVDQMHGVLELDSTPGEGSSFRIRLPALERLAANLPAGPAGDYDAVRRAAPRAVVVDDDPDVSGLLEVLLTDLGFRVQAFADANDAIGHVRDDPPDVLLIDVELPGLSGNAAVYRLRSQGYRGRVVTLSATATDEARRAALAAGADHYLTKPLNIEEFMRTMRAAAA